MSRLTKRLAHVAALAVLVAGASFAAQTPAANAKPPIEGALDMIDVSAKALKLQVDDQLQAVNYETATVFVDHDNKIELTNLQRGDKLKVDWVQRDKQKVAVRVEVVERVPGVPGLN